MNFVNKLFGKKCDETCMDKAELKFTVTDNGIVVDCVYMTPEGETWCVGGGCIDRADIEKMLESWGYNKTTSKLKPTKDKVDVKKPVAKAAKPAPKTKPSTKKVTNTKKTTK